MQIISFETFCIKCQTLFSGENKKNITNLLPAELAQRMVKVNNTASKYAWLCFRLYFYNLTLPFCTERLKF